MCFSLPNLAGLCKIYLIWKFAGGDSQRYDNFAEGDEVASHNDDGRKFIHANAEISAQKELKSDNNLKDSSQKEKPIEESETADQTCEQESNNSFATEDPIGLDAVTDKGQNSEDRSWLVDNDTIEPMNMYHQ